MEDLPDLDGSNSTEIYVSNNISPEDLERKRNNLKLAHPVRKYLYLISKFSTNEAPVDSFLSLLLRELGF
jgi:hypothetical protein